MALSRSAIDLLAITTNDDFIYLPHTVLVMSREKPNFDILVPALRVYFNYMVFPGLCGIMSSHINISDILAKVETIMDEYPFCLSVPKER